MSILQQKRWTISVESPSQLKVMRHFWVPCVLIGASVFAVSVIATAFMKGNFVNVLPALGKLDIVLKGRKIAGEVCLCKKLFKIS